MLNYELIKGKSSGKTVVFLHGFLENLSMWKVLNLQNYRFDSLLIDLPGHGKSRNEDEESPSISFFSSKINEVIDLLDLLKVDIVGHSMGGYVALNFKDYYSHRVEKIVLLNSNFWEDSISKKRDRLRVAEIVKSNKKLFINEAIPNLFNNKINNDIIIKELVEDASKMDCYSIAYSALSMRNRKDYSELVKKNNDDILIIQGDTDKVIPLSEMERKTEELNVNYKLIKKSGHMSVFESNKEVYSLLNEFL